MAAHLLMLRQRRREARKRLLVWIIGGALVASALADLWP